MPFTFFGDKKKAVIAMAHIGALPGAPDYDADGGVDRLIEGVLGDLAALQDGGVDAVMFGNEFDRPYQLKAPPEGVAAMTAFLLSPKNGNGMAQAPLILNRWRAQSPPRRRRR